MKKIILLCLLFSACLRVRQGEDVSSVNDEELSRVMSSMRYAQDARTGLCYAILNNATDGFRNTFTFTHVPCGAVREFLK